MISSDWKIMDYLEIVTHFYKLFITFPELLLLICSNISDCVLDGKQYADGSIWTDGCNQCTCHSGHATCQPLTCDCHVANTDRGCCPQCYETLTCPHQDIPGLRYNSGHRWIYDCMECECLVSVLFVLNDLIFYH